ncbi:TPA: HAD-IB family phosphatase [Vibrio parahaemolyticus]|uniref:HAD-IB family phosphatase n=1 Tax=Vibrio parahaemolyticus TaxID=670 RepID=UPI00041EA9D9|nr:HAD-IB family phosphatase [Vibrio parahaemolyticus]MBE4243269.1 haloacid dehalogenase-like hydrolase [Vibrio parahaemolyticus]HBC3373284.1 HAD-IB family phosphatase [Vibrio parahaemolyticus]HBH7859414.1 HAD-IB family phosphatase [Vibrio parahaemolyticus]HBH7902776.1 HAD-IB family phosphatase [Vibrio parahaemolyticus]
MDKLLFVDVCHTIVPHNTTVLFLEKYYIKSRALKTLRRILFVKLINQIIFKVFRKDIIRLLYINSLKNEKVSSVTLNADNFAKSIEYNVKVIEMIEKYKSEGYKVILLSASIEPVVSAICRHLSYDESLSSELNVRNDKYSSGICIDLLDAKDEIVKNRSKGKQHTIMISDNFGDSNCIPYLDEYIPVVIDDKSKLFWDEFKLNKKIDLRRR